MVIRHPLGRTVTTTDNIWFTLLTVNPNPIHFDAHYAAQTEFGKPLVNSTFTLALVTGLCVGRYLAVRGQSGLGRSAACRRRSSKATPSTRRAKCLSKRESKSRPHMGLVEIKSTGFKQDGTVVLEFRRTILVYKRGHEPKIPEPTPVR